MPSKLLSIFMLKCTKSTAVFIHHGLYGSTSCCISHGPCQWERAIFDPPQLGDPLDRFSWNLKYITTSRTRPPQAKFQGPTSTWVVWANSQFDAWKFLSYFRFFDTPTGRIFGHIPYVIICRFRQGSAFWGLERLNLTPFTPKKRKNWDFKLAVNGKL